MQWLQDETGFFSHVMHVFEAVAIVHCLALCNSCLMLPSDDSPGLYFTEAKRRRESGHLT